MKPYRVVKGDQHQLKVVYGDGSVELCTVTWKCRWYFNDNKARPRGFKVYHRFNKPGRVIAQFHVRNKIDGSRMDGYATVDVLERIE